MGLPPGLAALRAWIRAVVWARLGRGITGIRLSPV